MHVEGCVRTLQAFISNKEENYQAVVSGGGTAVQKKSDQSKIPTFSLPKGFKQCTVRNQITLIKTSTSGNDAGAVLSLGDSLYEMNPIFYIETDMSIAPDRTVLESQLESYLQMDNYLASHAYESCFVFDNFGNLLCKRALKYLHNYMYRMAMGKSNRTFYYLYVLACRKEFEDRCDSVVKRYIRDYT